MLLKAGLSEFSLSMQNWHLRHERAAATFGLHYILVVSTLWPGDKHQERFISVTVLYGICKHYVQSVHCSEMECRGCGGGGVWESEVL